MQATEADLDVGDSEAWVRLDTAARQVMLVVARSVGAQPVFGRDHDPLSNRPARRGSAARLETLLAGLDEMVDRHEEAVLERAESLVDATIEEKLPRAAERLADRVLAGIRSLVLLALAGVAVLVLMVRYLPRPGGT